MCGIVSILNFLNQPVSPLELERMTKMLQHRGPDDFGTYIDGNFGLGHQRLSVIDLSSAGQQPMTSADGQLIISYNGELYNFRELRSELKSAGYSFKTKTDTEVILTALSHWKEKALLKFNGMFAFSLWNKKTKELFIARDRYGVKPLYYFSNENVCITSSEIKAILQHSMVKTCMDPQALTEYLTFQNFLSDATLFKNIKLLPHGCYATISLEKPRLVIKRYWDYNFEAGTAQRDEKDIIRELHYLFEQSVNRQLVSDVPVGSYLSGGMDTGAITAIASHQIPNMHSFTIGFDLTSASGIEVGCDERPTAERMSYLFSTEHYEMVLKAGDMERCIKQLVWHLEEPRVGQCYPNFYAAKLASKFCKVVLSGAGGDELFAGYPWRYYRAIANTNFDAYIDNYYNFWQRLVPENMLGVLLSPIADLIDFNKPKQIFRNVFSGKRKPQLAPEDYINSSMYFEAKTFLQGLLCVDDKLSMAHGLETRVPFLDNDLVDFAMSLPLHFKLANLGEIATLNENLPGNKTNHYFNKTHDGKLILRKAMQKYLPQDITNAAKQGFSAPDASWFRGKSIDYVQQTLLGKNAAIYDFLDKATVNQLVQEHVQGKHNRRLLIWSLIYLEEWLSVFNKYLNISQPQIHDNTVWS